jgi:hypothetical protein
LEFVLHDYSTVDDVREYFEGALNMPFTRMGTIREPPLVVLNNFNTDETHVKLMAVTFQNMFPPVDVQKFSVTNTKRVVLFNYNPDDDMVEMRHYFIKRTKEEDSAFSIQQNEEEKKKKIHHIKLSDMGPHMKMSLYKVVEGVFSGETIYHSLCKLNYVFK